MHDTRTSGAALAAPAASFGLAPLAHRVALTAGWTRLALAWLAGACGALSMPPFGFLPALCAALVPAVWLLDGAATASSRLGRRAGTALAAGLIGWAWGFGYLTAGLWWLGAAFLVEADQFAYLMPLGVLGLPAILGLFYGFGFAVARLLWSPGPGRIAALAFGIGAAEWLRGHLFTGFPWNALGMALGQNLWLMQAAAVVGLHGLTVVAVLACAAPATLADAGGARRRLGPLLAALVVLAGLGAGGALRVPAGPVPEVPGVRLRLVQANIPQDARFNPRNREGILERYLGLSDSATAPDRSGLQEVTHLIWPESSFPFLIQRDPQALRRIGSALPPGTVLVTGAARADEPLPGERLRFYNSILMIGQDGLVGGRYDKLHLVPFGEYLPGPVDQLLRTLGLKQFVAVPGGFTPGEGQERPPLTVPGLPPVAPSICYEAIFPGAVASRRERPGLLLNVTNDGWFGDTPGPRQHFAQARLRAVEEGSPLVRAANTGISAVVDPYGRVTGMLSVGTEGVLDRNLPKNLRESTPYVRFGDVFFIVMLLGCGLLSLGARLRRAPSPPRGASM
ncbi:apolipoprotein N-acyltransferase [Methylobacterium nonmethylotrophicum]|uniref:Apolipoprotein N-acyltransferase n=1 Tax=Methylobacterium nonmethylotrophicum TaxID=1141884 RepID=A0A4Z0NJ72_9HYPH|nr:apolipoprotein N-acyltransferase [Methylobacterium nonmethylotrophicum]TGD95639.1 apolipoprotein N-acyltransferase [Methylobacterium nonmethylotrophicum]